MTTVGAHLITYERNRQIQIHGEEHDQTHENGELVQAAQEYLKYADWLRRHPTDRIEATAWLNVRPLHWSNASQTWPWAPEEFKPAPTEMGNLVIAGALIAAEIDRLKNKGDQELAEDSRRRDADRSTNDGSIGVLDMD